jgi:hypothetical protein
VKPAAGFAQQEKQSLKIDGAVALSFAVVAAEQSVPADIDYGFGSDEIKVISNYNGDFGRG